jgi:hypothetical protein
MFKRLCYRGTDEHYLGLLFFKIKNPLYFIKCTPYRNVFQIEPVDVARRSPLQTVYFSWIDSYKFRIRKDNDIHPITVGVSVSVNGKHENIVKISQNHNKLNINLLEEENTALWLLCKNRSMKLKSPSRKIEQDWTNVRNIRNCLRRSECKPVKHRKWFRTWKGI